ncbi:hypothetical protein GSH10_00045 [Burkholderia pseudomallei]|nr:hypothetical protein Y028_2642 [Burkholderia pseudomallei MSHR62]AJX77167.1 hypothetical protein BG16_552 [Burkholderia pseudomallei MSHR2543]KGW14813.1 hypothetical protein X980_1336 [Burkholderia pseudomallei MSHR4000]MBM5589062.1 hypothetical protein [Burkholderia pseudomallei]
MHVSLQQTLTPSTLVRQTIEPYFRAFMDAMIGLVQKWMRTPVAFRGGWAA